MVIVSRIAYRYAKSLFEQSKEEKSLDAVKQDMELVASTITESRDLQNLLKSPIISLDKKGSVLSKIFADKVSKSTSGLLTLLVTKGREAELLGVSNGFLKLYNEENNIVKAKLTTAISLDENLKKQFLKVANDATGKEVDLTEEVDEDLIGGYVLRFEDSQIDASIKTRLNKIKQQLFQ